MADSDPDNSASRQASAAASPAQVPGSYSRERVLLACAILLVALFAFTAFVSRQYHRTVHRLGDQWFAKGEAALQANQIDAAIMDYRNALVYKPDDATFEFHLAQALAAGGREDEARSYLLTLLTESPGSGSVNLALARVAVKLKNEADAVRYYHGAIYGVWNRDPLTRRWEVRRELCEYLLNQGEVRQAEPDLIALQQEVPANDVSREKIAANFLLRAGLWSRALTANRNILSVDRRDPDALAGAARAAFELAMYSDAAAYLERLPPQKRQSPEIASLLRMSAQAASMNAYRPGLRASEQARRAATALKVAEMRLVTCSRKIGKQPPAGSPAADVQQLQSTLRQNRRKWSQLNMAYHPDQVTAAMAFAIQAEMTASKACGPPETEADRALLLIGASRNRTAP